MAQEDYLIADFSKMEGAGSRPHVPEGDYHVKVKSVRHDTSKEGNRMYVWTYTGVSGKLEGKDIIDYTAITPKSLWKLYQVLEALGVAASNSSAVKIKIKQLVGKEMAVTLTDDEYNGRVTSKVADYMDLDTFKGGGLDDDDEDEDSEDDEEEEEEEDSLASMDRSELKAYIKENDLEVKVLKKMSDDDIRSAIKEAQGDDNEDDEDIGELELEDEDDM